MRLHLTPSSVEGDGLHRVATPPATFYLPEDRVSADLGVGAPAEELEQELRQRGVPYVVVADEAVRIVADYRGSHHLYLHLAGGRDGPLLTLTDDPFWFAGALPIDFDVARIVPLLKCAPPPLCLVRGAERLQPGVIRTYGRGNLRLIKEESYLVELFRPRETPATIDDVRETLAAIVAEEALRNPSALVFLSGGSDSALLVHLLKQCGLTPPTWTGVFDTPVGRREGSLAARTAAYYDVPWRSTVVDKTGALAELPAVLQAIKEPFADVALLAEAILALSMRRQSGIQSGPISIFEGEGMDALMCGSYRFVAERYRSWSAPLFALLPERSFQGVDRRSVLGALKLKLRQTKTLLQGGDSLFDRHLRYFQGDDFAAYVPAELRTRVADTFSSYYDLMPDLDELNRLAIMTFLGNNLNVDNQKLQSVAACASVHLCLPYQDPRFIRLAMSTPSDRKVGMGYGKRIIKQAFQRDLPRHTLTRRKSNFVPPVFDWVFPEHEELLFSSELFREDDVRRRIQEHRAGRQDHLAFLWGLLVTNAWIRRYETEASKRRRQDVELERATAPAAAFGVLGR